jgi:hypothetical protein
MKFGYIPIAGTNGWNTGWVVRDDDPFTMFMKDHGFCPVRSHSGRSFQWDTNLRMRFNSREFLAQVDALSYFSDAVPYEDRNYICHSHGGQLVLALASQGFKIRTLTTVATPPRKDIDIAGAEKNILYHQHVLDADRDWIATMKRRTLGTIGDGSWDWDREFKVEGVRNIPIKGIGHTGMFRDPKHFLLWVKHGVLNGIRSAGGRSATDRRTTRIAPFGFRRRDDTSDW